MDLENTYFYTATILKWVPLLRGTNFKKVIIDSLVFLVSKEAVKVYGFVIMPNHIHLIWRNLKMNGKEFPDESFLKFTGHAFQKELMRGKYPDETFLVHNADREHQYWQRSSLAITILSREMLEQKLQYLHLNPLQSHWDLASDPNDYPYSSCSFYERNDLTYPWLTDYRDDF